MVPPSLPGHPSQLHSRGRQSSGNIPVMLYRFYPAPVQGWTRSVFLFISLSTKFLANVFYPAYYKILYWVNFCISAICQSVSLSICQSVSNYRTKIQFLVLYFQLNLFYEEILYFCSNMSLWLKLLNFKMLKLYVFQQKVIYSYFC